MTANAENSESVCMQSEDGLSRTCASPTPEPKSASTLMSAGKSADNDVKSLKIMIVDDEPINVKVVCKYLRELGYENFVTTSDAERTVELIGKEQPDLVLLDIMMPRINGLEILKQLRNDAQFAHLPVIFLTASDDTSTRYSALELGATDFLSKPVEPSELSPRVRNALIVKAHHDHLENYAAQLAHEVRVRTEEVRKADLTASRAKSEFLANMCHEIRTPMTAILGFADNLLDAELSEDERIASVETICRNGEHLLKIINDILDLSKIEADKMVVERIDASPLNITTSVLELMQVRADAKQLDLTMEQEGAVPESIKTDPTRLRQILINLVGNAIKFTDRGSVRVVTRFLPNGGQPQLQFDVIDTGAGMTEQEVARLFQPFMQADNSTTRRYGGTGLGLAISMRLCELLGGEITVQSKRGSGSTFRATIGAGPCQGMLLMQSTPSVEDPSEGVVSAAVPILNCRILLAEDGLDNQRLISFVLNKAGAKVTVADNGQKAVELVTAASSAGKAFDVILMDMQMPVLDGYNATQQLRSEGHGGPIIALTAHAMQGDREKCLRAGCNDYATKPIDRVRLVGMIAEYSQGKDLTSETSSS